MLLQDKSTKKNIIWATDTYAEFAEECVAAPMMAKSIDIEPDDIDVTDTATFVWEIGGNAK